METNSQPTSHLPNSMVRQTQATEVIMCKEVEKETSNALKVEVLGRKGVEAQEGKGLKPKAEHMDTAPVKSEGQAAVLCR